MRVGLPRYPVDRYLVESSNNIELVNLIDEELWNSEPALRPEDELVLRRLHDMLHSTAEDLKLLTGQLAQVKQPGLLIKQQPTPLDEEFNQKIHIEELVNAKFHGHKIVDRHTLKHDTPKSVPNLNVTYSKPNINNAGVQVDSVPIVKNASKLKNLEVTRTRILEIDEKLDKNSKNKLNNGKVSSNKNMSNAPAVAYNEFTYQHEEPKITKTTRKTFNIQDMPSINIRSELKAQKVLQLDISPQNEQKTGNAVDKHNVAVIAVNHETEIPKPDPNITLTTKKETQHLPTKTYPHATAIKKPLVRKISKMSTCESSASANVSSDTLHNQKTQKRIKSVIRSSPKPSARERVKAKKTNLARKESDNRTHVNIDEWKKKLNVIYGQPSTSKNNKQVKQPKKSPKQMNVPLNTRPINRNHLNNAEYIPYSKLTLGGARVSDIEREISNIPNKNELPLSPIVDKILSSRENSFDKGSPKRTKKKISPRIFTTSDENLLEEVMDLEKKVSKTIKKSMEVKLKEPEEIESVSSKSKEEDNRDSYADDFEDDKSDHPSPVRKDLARDSTSESNRSNDSNNDSDSSNNEHSYQPHEAQRNTQNKTSTKKLNLSIKNSVDVFEFVHSVDRQDTATQSNTIHKISLKETQTSPRNDKPNIQPIHNDLWPIDPQGDVEKMFKLEKDFIKKLILEEYGEILEKNIAKPSTSKGATENKQTNVVAVQKITQTSPARAKSVMTSPTTMKTRTTSPFLSVTVDHHTSPMLIVTNEEHLTVEVDNEEDGISINLSSPRFNLRLPQSSREILSNLEDASLSKKTKNKQENEKTTQSKTFRKSTISSSSSEVGNSSELSSLGEVKLKRKHKKRVVSISESSDTSCVSKTSSDMPSGGIIPLRSEGEVSFKQMMRKVSNKTSKSEGEANIGRTK